VILIADTSGLFAALDTDHPASDVAYQLMQSAGLVVISPLVLAELDHLARRSARLSGQAKAVGSQRARTISGWICNQHIQGRIAIPAVGGQVLSDAVEVMNRYHDVHLDLADAINIALAGEYDTDAILTLDERDFRLLRPLGGYQAFRILPADQ
jgi:predicted nucleic acid-binding protein